METDLTVGEQIYFDYLEKLNDEFELGTDEHHKATTDIKILADIQQEGYKLSIEADDKAEKRQLEEKIRNAEIELKKAELDLKARELDIREKEVNARNNDTSVSMSKIQGDKETANKRMFVDILTLSVKAIQIGIGGFALWKGYKFEYIDHGFPSGMSFKNVKNSVEKFIFNRL